MRKSVQAKQQYEREKSELVAQVRKENRSEEYEGKKQRESERKDGVP